ncbi:hypothetical protein EJB05_37254 [Eragrostis curvula]|uniref:Uncharacterized protein n=1 Tax=Eragrostis curvula TaxID=38414 RepID=A0A5J9TR14_9POAL|nr:hypothetical protein EJB05_37254 [Eragrostis curvula]
MVSCRFPVSSSIWNTTSRMAPMGLSSLDGRQRQSAITTYRSCCRLSHASCCCGTI